MRALNALVFIEREFYKAIYYINENPPRPKDGRTEIANKISEVKQRFTEYETNKARLEHIPDSGFTKESVPALYQELYDLYDFKEGLKTKIRDISGIKCPYCGINESPFHVDHYLPRFKFPEFSIYTSNLIAACASCNSRYKGTDFIDEQRKRLYFNPYFDSFIDDIQFLKCSITVDGGYITFEFFIDPALESTNEYEYNIIKNHFEKLNLAERYLEQITKELFVKFKNGYIIANGQSKCFEDVTLEELRGSISQKIRELREYNSNNWEKVFWLSLKQCDDCLNLIVHKQIPIN